ncbi:hypothetical protein V8E36_000917 [Tilletia maclaganii]
MSLPSKATLVAGGAAASGTSAPAQPRTQTKLAIPFPDDARSGDLSIAGILAHAEPLSSDGPGAQAANDNASASSSRSGSQASAGAEPRPLALILHGVLAHKDQIYHKKLVAALDMDSFRFDFRANHETPGTWSMASFHEDIEDMRCVISYLRRHHNYRVHVLIAHSRGALDAWMYLGEQERNRRDARRSGPARNEDIEVPPYVVSLSGRWRMERIHDRTKLYEAGFKAEGFYRWKARVAGKDVEVHITPEQVADFAKFPLPGYVRDAPLETDVLLITGTADKVVPTSDVGYYVNALSSQPGRRPGSVQVYLVEHADHNFIGHYDEVVQAITDWLQSRRAIATTVRRGSAESLAADAIEPEPANSGLIPSRATATSGATQGKL